MPGVAAGGFQQAVAGLNRARPLGLLNHELGDAVLDAAGGILPLQLGIDVNVLVRTETLQLHQWRIADGTQNALLDARAHPTRAIARTFHVVSFTEVYRSVLAAGMLVGGQTAEHLIVD